MRRLTSLHESGEVRGSVPPLLCTVEICFLQAADNLLKKRGGGVMGGGGVLGAYSSPLFPIQSSAFPETANN